MSDTLVKALAFDDQIRVFAVNATKVVNTAHEKHDTWSAATAALGRTLVGTLLLASDIKDDAKVMVQISGNGPGGKLVAVGNGEGQVKGYIDHPHVSLELNTIGKLDVRGVVGTEGTFTVTKDLGMGEPFSGQVPIVSGEIAEDFTYYLAVSEQIPSAVGLGALVSPDESVQQAGGWMIQVLPDASEEAIQAIETAVKNTPQVTQLLQEGHTPEQIIARLVGEGNYRLLTEEPVSFVCDCSKERFSRGLAALPSADIQEMIDEDGGAEAVCHFCNTKYQFNEDELLTIQRMSREN